MLRTVTRDVGRALGTWVTIPLLPACSLALNVGSVIAFSAAASLPQSQAVLQLALTFAPVLILAGYSGTERLWYKRAWEGATLSPSQIGRATWGYVPRFLGVGFVWVVVLLPFEVIATGGVGVGHDPARFAIVVGAGVVVFDVLATFITPGITFTTKSADRGIRLGLRLLWTTWPNSAVYVIFPPFALLMLTRFNLRSVGLAFVIGANIVTTLLALAAKGATASYYLRLAIEPEEGAEPVSAGFATQPI